MVAQWGVYTNLGEVYFVYVEGNFNVFFLAAKVEYEFYAVIVDIGGYEEGVDKGLLVVFVVDIAVLEHLEGGDDFILGELIVGLLLGGCDQAGEIAFLGFQFSQAGLGSGGEDTGLDGVHQIVQGTVDISQVILQAVKLGGGGVEALVLDGSCGKNPYRIIGEHGVPKGCSYKAFDVIPADIALVAAGVVGSAAFAGIVEVGVGGVTGAGYTDHGAGAVTAEELAGEKVDAAVAATLLRGLAGGISAGVVLEMQDALDGIEELLGDDLGDSAGAADVAVYVNASITLIAEEGIEAGAVPPFPGLGGDAAAIQVSNDFRQLFPGIDTAEDLPDNLGLRLADGVAAVWAFDIAKGEGTIYQTFLGVVLMAALNLAGQLLGVVLGKAFQEGFHENPGGVVGDILHGGEHLDTAVFQLALIDGTVVTVACETVQGVDDDVVP